MRKDDIQEYLDKEVLLITEDDFRNYGIIEAVNDDTTKMNTPCGRVSIINKSIKQIREKSVVW